VWGVFRDATTYSGLSPRGRVIIREELGWGVGYPWWGNKGGDRVLTMV